MLLKVIPLVFSVLGTVFLYAYLTDYSVIITLLAMLICFYLSFYMLSGLIEATYEEIKIKSKKLLAVRIVSISVTVFLSLTINVLLLSYGKLLAFSVALIFFWISLEIVYNLIISIFLERRK